MYIYIDCRHMFLGSLKGGLGFLSREDVRPDQGDLQAPSEVRHTKPFRSCWGAH